MSVRKLVAPVFSSLDIHALPSPLSQTASSLRSGLLLRGRGELPAVRAVHLPRQALRVPGLRRLAHPDATIPRRACVPWSITDHVFNYGLHVLESGERFGVQLSLRLMPKSNISRETLESGGRFGVHLRPFLLPDCPAWVDRNQ